MALLVFLESAGQLHQACASWISRLPLDSAANLQALRIPGGVEPEQGRTETRARVSSRGRVCARLLAQASSHAAQLAEISLQAEDFPEHRSPLVSEEPRKRLKAGQGLPERIAAVPGTQSRGHRGGDAALESAGTGPGRGSACGHQERWGEAKEEEVRERWGLRETQRQGDGASAGVRGSGDEGAAEVVRRLEEQAGVSRELAWEALHGGPWRDASMDWRNAHALSCWLLALARVHRGDSAAALAEALKLLDTGLLLGCSGALQACLRSCISRLQLLATTRAELPTDKGAGLAACDVPPPNAPAAGDDAGGLACREAGICAWELGTGSGSSPHRRARTGLTEPAVESGGEGEGEDGGGGHEASMQGITHSRKTLSLGSGPGPSSLPEGAFACQPVERWRLPSMEEFMQQAMQPGVPVVVTGAMAHWPALGRWGSMDYLQSVAGLRTVPVELGSHYLEDNWTQQLMTLSDFIARHVSGMHRVSESSSTRKGDAEGGDSEGPPAGAEGRSGDQGKQNVVGSAEPLGYLAQHPLFDQVWQCLFLCPLSHENWLRNTKLVWHATRINTITRFVCGSAQIPELRHDIVIPDYCFLTLPTTASAVKCPEGECPAGRLPGPLERPVQGTEGREHSGADSDDEDEKVKVNAWFGPAGTVTPLHTDPYHNLLAQVVGKKYVRIYGTEQTEALYPYTESMLCNASQVDLHDVNHETFPLFHKAPYWDVVLEEGEMLYLPPKYWHFVQSLSLSFSVSFWW